MKKRTFTPGIMALADQGMVSGINLLATVILGRSLGLEGFGTYALGWMVVLLASSLQQALLLTPMKSLAPQQKETHDYFSATTHMAVLFSAVAFPALWITGTFLSLSLAFPLAAVAFLSQAYTRRRAFVEHKISRAFTLDLIAYGGWALGLIAASWAGVLSIDLAYYLMALSFGMSALGGFLTLPIALKDVFSTTTLPYWRQHWAFGSWLTGTALLQYVSGNAFVLAAGIFLGPATLGLVRAIQTLMGTLHVFLLAAEHIIPVQAAAQYAQNGIGGLQTYLGKIKQKGLLPTALLLVFIALWGNQILDFIFDFSENTDKTLVQLFVLSYVGTIASFPLRISLRTVSHTRPFFMAYVFSAGLGLVFAKPIIASLGVWGVPLGLILGQAITFSLLFFSWKNYLRSQNSAQPLHS